MEYLLDTHAFLWFIAGNSELSEKAKELILNPDNLIFVSLASFWEIAIKLKNGKLEIDIPFNELKNQALINGFKILLISFEDVQGLTVLEMFHRDPFYRLINKLNGRH